MLRGPQGAAEPARYALLGLLAGGPRHGYDLARSFASDSALGEVLHLSASHLYALLGRLERDGLIHGHREEVVGYPTRRVYEITAVGREALLAWLHEPVEHPRDMRIEFPLKLYLALLLDPGHARTLIERQRDFFSSYVRRLDDELVARDASPADASFIALMRDARRGRLLASLAWLDRCTDVISVPQ